MHCTSGFQGKSLEGVLMNVTMFMFIMHDIVVLSTYCDDMHGMSPNESV